MIQDLRLQEILQRLRYGCQGLLPPRTRIRQSAIHHSATFQNPAPPFPTDSSPSPTAPSHPNPEYKTRKRTQNRKDSVQFHQNTHITFRFGQYISTLFSSRVRDDDGEGTAPRCVSRTSGMRKESIRKRRGRGRAQKRKTKEKYGFLELDEKYEILEVCSCIEVMLPTINVNRRRNILDSCASDARSPSAPLPCSPSCPLQGGEGINHTPGSSIIASVN